MACLITLSACAPSHSAEPPAWRSLFDGKTLDGWMTSDGKESRTRVEDASINPHKSGHYMLVHKEKFENFVLSMDFKISKGCNSGIFVRTSSLTPRPGKDIGFNGIEIAIDDTTAAGYHDTGAIYDLVKPQRNAMRPTGQWNHIQITCDGPIIEVAVNGAVVSRMNCDEFIAPNKRPDGSMHKFDVAFKNHPRLGYIGLQDHGSPCWFRDIRIRELKK
jgi:hypothetical protein